jgi:pimeloyl-ACP methyl ester carboxylesterase
MKHLGKTRPFRGSKGEAVPGSIAEVGYLHLGGLDQWVMIRGESLANPLFVLLHGGPGFSDTHFFRRFNSPLEKVFTVVYWDQRGTGKSFDSRIPRSSMTVEQFISDLDELVEAMCKRVGKKNAVIFGHSWGAALGVLYAARFPEKVAAYVGSRQVGDWAAGESSSYAFALAEARRLNDRKAMEKLRAIGPPPHTAQSLWTQRMCLNRIEGNLRPRALWSVGRLFLGAPEFSIFDLPNMIRGFRFPLDAMWDEVSRINLTTAVPALETPVFFFLGRNDHWVPPETSVAYFDALTAPSKRLVWFEESGHEPFVDEPAKFNASMVELVRHSHHGQGRPLVQTGPPGTGSGSPSASVPTGPITSTSGRASSPTSRRAPTWGSLRCGSTGCRASRPPPETPQRHPGDSRRPLAAGRHKRRANGGHVLLQDGDPAGVAIAAQALQDDRGRHLGVAIQHRGECVLVHVELGGTR